MKIQFVPFPQITYKDMECAETEKSGDFYDKNLHNFYPSYDTVQVIT